MPCINLTTSLCDRTISPLQKNKPQEIRGAHEALIHDRQHMLSNISPAYSRGKLSPSAVSVVLVSVDTPQSSVDSHSLNSHRDYQLQPRWIYHPLIINSGQNLDSCLTLKLIFGLWKVAALELRVAVKAFRPGVVFEHTRSTI